MKREKINYYKCEKEKDFDEEPRALRRRNGDRESNAYKKDRKIKNTYYGR